MEKYLSPELPVLHPLPKALLLPLSLLSVVTLFNVR